MASDTNSTFDWEKELYSALNDEIITENPRPISPVSPLTKEFGVQVRKWDFLTTSRDTQTEQVFHPPISKVLKNQSTQTNPISIDTETQTNVKQAVDAACQMIKNTIDQNFQADFFNAGLITHTLMDAIKSIAPTPTLQTNPRDDGGDQGGTHKQPTTLRRILSSYDREVTKDPVTFTKLNINPIQGYNGLLQRISNFIYMI